MRKVNYHTHTVWCDGKDTPEDMVLSAIDKGFELIGFSSHMAFPMAEDWQLNPSKIGEYVNQINALRKKYAGKIEILCGAEADYVRGQTTPEKARYAAYGIEYLIGSLHSVVASDGSCVAVDASVAELQEGIAEHFNGDAKAFVCSYFEQQREMLRYDFDILGHPDLVRKFNGKHPYFDEDAKWYIQELEKTAEAIAGVGKIVEVNTGAISRGWLDDAYPSALFRSMLRGRGVRFILSSDAHNADSLDCAFDRFADAEVFEDTLCS
jgi:histidinol-phosphatase (PHP family)